MSVRTPVVVLQSLSLTQRLSASDCRALTRSSSSSASALNLLTKLVKPKVPDFPKATKGLNLEPNDRSRNTNLGYAMGIPAIIGLAFCTLNPAEIVPVCSIK